MTFIRSLIKVKAGTIAILSIFLVLLACGLRYLEVTTDNRVFYGPDNEYFRDFLVFENTFISNDNVVFVVNGKDILTPELFRATAWLTERSLKLSHAIRVDSLTNYPFPSATIDTFEVVSIAEESCRRSTDCYTGLRSIAADMNLTNRLISPDLKSTGIIVTLNIERGRPGIIEHLQQQIYSIEGEFNSLFPNLRIVHTGGVPMMAAFANASKDDLSRLLPIAFFIICILSFVFLRSTTLAMVPILVGVAASGATMGLAGWIGLIINNATSIAPLVIFVLVISISMHTVMRFRSLLENGSDASDGAIEAIRQTFSPLSVSVLTSVVSLTSLYFLDSPPLKQLGFLSACGLILGYFLTLTMIPALLALVGSRIIPRRGLLPLKPFVFVHPGKSLPNRWIAGVVLIALIILSTGISRLYIDDDFVRFFDESVSFRKNTVLATELLVGPNHIEVVMSARPDQSVFDPNFIRDMSELTSEIRKLKGVKNAASFSDLILQISRPLNLGDSLAELSPDEIHQIFLAYELSLTQGQSNTDMVSMDYRSARISVLLDETSSRDIQNLEQSIRDLHESAKSNSKATITGENIPVAHLTKMNLVSMANGLVLAALLIGIITSLVLRSLSAGLIGCLAVALPLLAGFGSWGWFVGEIGIAATAIIALTMGVVVDDNVHFLFEALKRQHPNLGGSLGDVGSRVSASITVTLPSIIATSTILGAGLFALSFSHFEVNKTFGIIASMIILLALVTTIFILPHGARLHLEYENRGNRRSPIDLS